MAEFFDMGGYAAFVWPAFGLTALVLGGLLVSALVSLGRVKARLAAREAALDAGGRPPRQRRQSRQDSAAEPAAETAAGGEATARKAG